MPEPIKNLELTDRDFPLLLKEIPGPPEKIFYLGRPPGKDEKTVAIVGTRKATHDGLTLAGRIARELAGKGFTIASGLALGIDTAAHAGALEGGGRTVAVLGNGLDKIYPAQNENLARKILEKNGAIVSEYPEGTPAYPNQFLERNRIVSGLSLAVVVIEAPIRSGSLVTAKHALEQGREVFIVPGPAGHPNYEGSHMLLRQGARLVTNAAEILEDLNVEITGFQPLIPDEKPELENETELMIFEAIRNAGEPLQVDNIIQKTKLEPKVVNQNLTSLMLQGLIEERNGKFRIRN